MKTAKLLWMLGLAFGALNANAQTPGAPAVTIGVAPSTDMALMIIAVKQGFLQKEGVNAQLQVFDSSPAALQGVVAGRADITNNTEPPQLGARARGAKIVQIMTGYQSGRGNGSVVNDDVIKKPEDFVGKSIGVQRGSGAHYHLAWFLQRNNIPAEKVNVRFMDAPDQIAALARGDIQGFFSWEPFLARAADTVRNAKIFSRTIDDGFSFSGNVVMREDMAQGRKDVAVKVVRGLVAAADWIRANPTEAGKVANEVLKAPSVEIVAQQIQFLDWPGDFRTATREQAIRIADWGIGIGLFPAKDGRKLVDDLMYPALIKEAAPGRTDF